MKVSPKIQIALPVLNESENLPAFLDCMRSQHDTEFKILACVNNYDSWWDDPDKLDSCIDNQQSINLLASITDVDIGAIDKSSKGNGWPDKKGGVGWARKLAMDHIAANADMDDLIVCMDADTFYPDNYLSSILSRFDQQKDLNGIALPYYHKLTGDETDRLILRYEIYMRYYLLNMLRIKNPFSFTALGSAMAVPVWAYKKIGGLTPVKSGEDFYFLQKLVKSGKIGIWCDTVAYPSSRFSDRVLFGTGPALIKGNSGNWNSYPVYNYEAFNRIGVTFSMFSDLYYDDLPTPMDAFLKDQFRTSDLWNSFRINYRDESNFVRACTGKVDGLRILQYLRSEHEKSNFSDELNLMNWFNEFYKDFVNLHVSGLRDLDFNKTSLSVLKEIRDFLFREENIARKAFDHL